jgi:hypothetical protein
MALGNYSKAIAQYATDIGHHLNDWAGNTVASSMTLGGYSGISMVDEVWLRVGHNGIYDLAGTPTLSINPNARILYADDGTSLMIDWSNKNAGMGYPGIIIEQGSGTPQINFNVNGAGLSSNAYIAADVSGFRFYAGYGNYVNFESDIWDGGAISMSPTSRTLYGTDGATVMDWSIKKEINETDYYGAYIQAIFDSGEYGAILVNERSLVRNTELESLNWQQMYLSSHTQSPVLYWDLGTIYDIANSTLSIDWENRIFYDVGGHETVSYSDGYLSSTSLGVRKHSIAWMGREMYDYNENKMFDWSGGGVNAGVMMPRNICDTSYVLSIDPNTRVLYAPDGNTPAISFGSTITNFGNIAVGYNFYMGSNAVKFENGIYSGQIDMTAFGNIEMTAPLYLEDNSILWFNNGNDGTLSYTSYGYFKLSDALADWVNGILSIDQNSRIFYDPSGVQIGKWSGGDFVFDIQPDFTNEPEKIWGVSNAGTNQISEVLTINNNNSGLSHITFVDASAGTGDRVVHTVNFGDWFWTSLDSSTELHWQIDELDVFTITPTGATFYEPEGGGETLAMTWDGSGNPTLKASSGTLFVEDSDFIFVGSGGGLPYGACYGANIAWVQTSATQNTWYLVSDTDMNDGPLNLLTHDGSGKLTVTYAGTYKIDMAISLEMSTNNKHLEYGVSINGGSPSMYQREFFGVNSEEQHGSLTRIITLSANDTIEFAVRTPDTGTPDIGVDNLSITVVMIGG